MTATERRDLWRVILFSTILLKGLSHVYRSEANTEVRPDAALKRSNK